MIVLWGFCMCLAAPPSFIHGTSRLAQVAPPTVCPNTTYSCAGKGDDCTGDLNTPTCNLTNSSCCGTGLYCINKTCAIDNEGTQCQNNTQCMQSSTGGPIMCVSGSCQYVYGPGDECDTNANCYGGLNCTNGTCQGIALNMACNVSGLSTCAWGLYCGLNPNLTAPFTICISTIPNGGVCNGSSPCAFGNTCIQNKCVADYSQGTGTTCFGNSCNTGLVCATNNNTCVSATTSLTSCTNSTDCTAGTVCVCSPFSGDSFCDTASINPCTSEAQTLETCLKDNNCTTGGNDSPMSCCYNNCYSSYKKSFSCGCSITKSLFGNCFYNTYCSGFPIWAIIVIIVVVIVIVLAVVLLVFFMMRRRRQYDSI